MVAEIDAIVKMLCRAFRLGFAGTSLVVYIFVRVDARCTWGSPHMDCACVKRFVVFLYTYIATFGA